MGKLMGVTVVAVLAAAVLSAQAGGGNSASKSGTAVAFAKVNLGTQKLLTFGGKGTTAAALSDGTTNSFAQITFTGKYPKNLSVTQAVINVSCESENFGVANAYALSVSSTQLVIGVYGWESSTENYQGDRVFVTVYLGQ